MGESLSYFYHWVQIMQNSCQKVFFFISSESVWGVIGLFDKVLRCTVQYQVDLQNLGVWSETANTDLELCDC